MALLLYITKADYLGGLSVKLTFNDGIERTLDFSSFFKKTLIRSITNMQHRHCSRNSRLKVVISFGERTGI